MSRANINACLRRRRALRVALGERRFRWRPMDRRGRIPFGFIRICRSFPETIQQCHDWLRLYRSKGLTLSDSWWFSVEELAFDEGLQYSCVVDHKEVLVFNETLWTGLRDPFVCSDRKAVCYG